MHKDWNAHLEKLRIYYKGRPGCKYEDEYIRNWFYFGQLDGDLLEVGPGPENGHNIRKLLPKSVHYTGLDPIWYDDHVVLSGIAEHMPFPDHVFDTVVCISTLQHVNDPDLACSEIMRVLKPGGQFWGTIYCAKSSDIILHSFDVEKCRMLIDKYFTVFYQHYNDSTFYFKARK